MTEKVKKLKRNAEKAIKLLINSEAEKLFRFLSPLGDTIRNYLAMVITLPTYL